MTTTPTARFHLETDEFERALAEEMKSIQATAASDIDHLGVIAADRMRSYVPVGSERKLLESIDSRPGDDERGHYVDVGSFGVWYALYVEMGTSEQEAQPFILPGLEEGVADWAGR